MRTFVLAAAFAALSACLSVSPSFAGVPTAAATGVHKAFTASSDVDTAACVRRRVCERGRGAYRMVCR